MQRLLLVISISFISVFSYSQSHTPRMFNLSFGFDGGIHGVQHTEKFDDGILSTENISDTTGARTNMLRFDGHFNITKSLSIGVQYRNGQYLEDIENIQADGNKITVVGLSARFYAVNKEKFALYLGGSLGRSNLTINRQFIFIVPISWAFKYSGSHYGLELGFNWYFSNNFGLNFGLGYAGQKYKMTDFSINGKAEDLTNYENELLTKGATINIGATFKLGGK